jgi:hypothetical protein
MSEHHSGGEAKEKKSIPATIKLLVLSILGLVVRAVAKGDSKEDH